MQHFTRRNFLQASGLFGLFALSGCGSDHTVYGSGGVTPPKKASGDCAKNDPAVEVEMLHDPNHDLSIPAVDVTAGLPKTYMLGDNGSGHVHEITLTSEDFSALRLGRNVTVVSTLAGHVHRVTVGCV